MRRVSSFVYGHVVGALISGVIGGAFLYLTAVMVFGAGLAGADGCLGSVSVIA